MDWLEEELGDYEDDYLIFDCPGQIELYTHFPIMRRICEALQRWNFAVCGVYCLESQFIEDKSKYFSGVLSAMSAMINMEIPHINVMTKMDLVEGDYGNQAAADQEDSKDNKGSRNTRARRSARSKTKKELERYFDPDPLLLIEDVNNSTSSRFHALNQSIVQLVRGYKVEACSP
jgi:GTPase SAR1 family protein